MGENMVKLVQTILGQSSPSKNSCILGKKLTKKSHNFGHEWAKGDHFGTNASKMHSLDSKRLKDNQF